MKKVLMQMKLGALALIVLMLAVPFEAGCNGVTAAQDIVNWMPAIQSAVQVVSATGSVLDPAAAPIFVAATAGFNAASGLLTTAAQTYLANPGATNLQQLQAQIVAFQQEVNTALLQAVKIVNPASQQKATTDINAVATAVNAVLALVLSISSKAQASKMAAAAQVKVAQLEPVMRPLDSARILAAHYKTDTSHGYNMEVAGVMQLQAAGF